MPQIFLQFVIPLAVSAIKSYISNSSSKQDDKVLDVVQEGCKYLCEKDNNNLSPVASLAVNSASMIKGK